MNVIERDVEGETVELTSDPSEHFARILGFLIKSSAIKLKRSHSTLLPSLERFSGFPLHLRALIEREPIWKVKHENVSHLM